MKCQSLFSVETKKNISKCRLLKCLPSILFVCGAHSGLKIFDFILKSGLLINEIKLAPTKSRSMTPF